MEDLVKRTDYVRGEEPVPVGSIVNYFGSCTHGEYTVISHAEPENTARVLDEDMPTYFPDGVAYELWPTGVPRRFGNRDKLVRNVRRLSFRVLLRG